VGGGRSRGDLPPPVRSLRGHEVCPEEDRPDHRDEQNDEPGEREVLASETSNHPGDGQDRHAEHEVHLHRERNQTTPPADPEHQQGDRNADEQWNEVALGLLRGLLLKHGRVVGVGTSRSRVAGHCASRLRELSIG